MSQATHWSSHFQISQETLSVYTREAQAAGLDVLRWCLMNGKIPQEEYLKWAMNAYQLPVVKTDFFTSPPDLELWKRTKDLAPWNASLVPLTEWHGCLFIGCLEPPADFKLAKRHHFVLASARNLFMLWSHFNPTPVTDEPSLADFSRPMPGEEESQTDADNEDTVVVETPDAMAAPPPEPAAGRREPRPLEACTSQSDLGQIVISHILQTFEGAMILLFEKDRLRPWLFSDLFRSEKNKELPTIELETPSIFRVVKRTKLPYHGYVMPSPTNDAFFAAYLGGKTPQHATLVPVIVDDNLFAVLMGVANSEIDYKNSLVQMERLADEMAQHLVRLKLSNAA